MAPQLLQFIDQLLDDRAEVVDLRTAFFAEKGLADMPLALLDDPR